VKSVLIFIFVLFSLSLNAQIISLFAGRGTGGGIDGLGDGLHADSAIIPDPVRGTFDKHGNYYFVSALSGNRIRKVDNAGIISSVVGTGNNGFNGDGGLADTSDLNEPDGIILDTFGNLYIADAANNRIRKVDNATGIISTIAGTGVGGFGGDSGLATNALLNDPIDICFDKFGNLYISDFFNTRVRKVNTLGIITTFAGTGIIGYSGDGSRADTSKIGGIESLCTDTAGNVYLADGNNSRIFKVNTAGVITTFAGTSTGYLYNGDDIPATSANIDPVDINFDDTGNLYIAEYRNYRVRKVDIAGIIHTVAGKGIVGFSGDGGPADSAEFNYPSGVAIDACGNLYIPEAGNKCVRKVTYDSICNPYTTRAPQLLQSQIAIYPNPASSILHIDGIESASKYELFNIIGIIEQSGTLQKGSNELPISALPPGMYLLQLKDEHGQKTLKKVIKE